MAHREDFASKLQALNAEFGEWLGVSVVDHFGDAAGELETLQRGALCVSDRSARGTVVAVGADVVQLLQGVVTSDVFALAEPGRGQFSTAVNAQGRMVCDLRIAHGPEVLLLDFEPGLVEGGVISHFRANVMMEDAKFIDRSAHTAVLGLFGDEAAALLDELLRIERGVAHPSALQLHHVTWGQIGDVDAVVRRTELGFDVLLDAADALHVWELLSETKGARPIGEQALEAVRVERGFPRWGAELDEKIIPLEAGLGDTISFDKGCYVGQEIIARLDTLGTPAKLLRQLALSAAVARGAKVFDGTKAVGEVRSTVGNVALAYVKRDHNEVGHALHVGDERVEATIRG